MRSRALAAFLAMTTSVPAAAPAQDVRLQAAYDAGKDVGTSVPLIVWGSLWTAVGVVSLAAGEELQDSDGADDGVSTAFRVFAILSTVVGAAQLLPGLYLAGRRDDPARFATPESPKAYDAGYDHGVGRTLVVYGAICAGLLLGYSDDAKARNLVYASVLPASQLGYGAWSWSAGETSFDELMKARPQAPAPAPTAMLPVVRVRF